MGRIDFLLSICSIIIPVFATIYTVNNRIKNSNRENHQPYLILEKLERVSKIDIYKYHLNIMGKNYFLMNREVNDKEITILNIDLLLKNIGYGVATNVKFYDLYTSNQIEGKLEVNKSQDQKLFTTLDVASGGGTRVQSNVISLLKDEESNIVQDNSTILCVYQDLHKNVYTFIINITIKNKSHCDFFAYQPSSQSYKKLIEKSKKEYRTILKKYSRL